MEHIFGHDPSITVKAWQDGTYGLSYKFQTPLTAAQQKAWDAIWYDRYTGPGGVQMRYLPLLKTYKLGVARPLAVLTYTSRIAEAVQETGVEFNIPRKTTDAVVDILRQQVALVPGGAAHHYDIESPAREEKSGKTVPLSAGGGRRYCRRCGKNYKSSTTRSLVQHMPMYRARLVVCKR